MNHLERRTAGQLTMSIVLGAVSVATRRHRRAGGRSTVDLSPGGPERGIRYWTGVSAALAGPAVVITRALAGQRVGIRPPPSVAGKVALLLYVGSGAASEELCWRLPLTFPMRRRLMSVLAALSGASFVAAHLPKDGRRGLPAHVVNTAAWTGSAILTRSLRWSVLSHWVYNLVGYCVLPQPADQVCEVTEVAEVAEVGQVRQVARVEQLADVEHRSEVEASGAEAS